MESIKLYFSFINRTNYMSYILFFLKLIVFYLGSLFPPTQPLMFKMTAYDLRACQSPPQVIPTVIVGSVKVDEPHGLLTIINKIGGMPLILFLFARVSKLLFMN